MSSLKLKHSGGNSVSIAAPSSNPAANRTINLNDNYAGDGSFVTANSSGKVGINTASPVGKLTVDENNASEHFQLRNTTNTSNFAALGVDSSFNLRVYTNGTNERMRLTSAGKFYVGTTNGAFANDASQHAAIVNSAANVYTLSLRNNLDSSDGRGLLVAAGNGSGGRLIFFERFDGSTLGSITVASASSVSYNTSSDYRLKENVTTITDGITRLKTLKPSKFNFIEDKSKTLDGFLAHEVSSVVPEAITGTKDEVDADNNPVYQGIDQSKLVPLLTAALQEAITKIETLETKVAALEAA